MSSPFRQRKRSISDGARVALALVCIGALVFGLRSSFRAPRPFDSQDDDGEFEEAKHRPSEWHWLQRTWPYFDADRDVLRRALEVRKSIGSQSAKRPFGAWEFLGPSNVGGRIVDIEFNPQHPDTVYLAAATGGIFKSVDGGQVWTPVFDEQAVLTVGDIAVDPLHSDTIFVGTGEANGGHNNFAGGGLYRSDNGGETWSYSGLEEVVSIGRVVIDPSNSNRVFVAAVGSYFSPHAERGVYRSEDGAQTWQKVLFVSDSTGAIDLAVNPRNPDTLFAATWERVRRPNGAIYLHGAGSGVHRSVDGGTSWQRLGPEHGLPDPEQLKDETGRPQIGRIGLSISKSDPSTIFALFTDGFTFLGLYRSRDGGDNWEPIQVDSNFRSAFSDFSWYFGQIRVAPHDPETVFVLDFGIALTTDGGDSWTTSLGTHVDQHALAFHPDDSQILLEGNDGGLSRSTDGGTIWTSVKGLPITQFYEIAVDPSDTDDLLGGTQDNGTLRSFGLQKNTWYSISGGDGFYTLVDPDDPSTVYSSSQNGQLYRSGSTIVSPQTYKSNWSTPIAIDPVNSATLYYGSDRLLRSTNRGASWNAVSGNLTSHASSDRLGTITTISVSSTDPSVIYVGTDDGNVWVTRDSTATWTNISDALPQRWATRIESHPDDPGMAVVTFSGLRWREPQPHVFRTFNYGESWQDISSNLPDAPVNALALDPTNQEQIFVGTDVGAFHTDDGGLSWQLTGTGLPAIPVYDLKFIADRRRLVAGTHGRSMYAIQVPDPPTSIDPGAAAEDITPDAVAFPNPFITSVTIEFRSTALRQTNPRIVIFDILGREVTSVTAESIRDGIVSAKWDGSGSAGNTLAAGVYIARLETGMSTGPQPAVTVVRTN